MRNSFAIILVLILAGCGGDQKSRQAGISQGDLSRPFASEQLPVRDALPAPVAAAAPAQKSEPRAEVVQIPDTEIDSTASNNASQQSATALLSNQFAKFAESIDASLVRIDARIVAQNEMNATAIADLRAEIKAEFRAELKAVVRAEVSALGQAGIGNSSRQESTNVGGNLTMLFSDGMERLMTKMISVIDSIVLAFVGTFFAGLLSMLTAIVMMLRQSAQLRERDEKRDDANDRLLISLVGVLAKGSDK